MENKTVLAPREIPREIKIVILKALKVGIFDSEALEQMKEFLFPNGEPITIEIIDNRTQVADNQTQIL